MLLWFMVFVFALIARVWAKTRERNAASALTISIYRGKNEEAVTLAGTLITRPTPVNELGSEIVQTLPPLALLYRFVYMMFAFSVATPDTRTPHAFALWDVEQKFYDLHDPDIAEGYRLWRAAYFWDGVSAGVLCLVFMSVCSRTIFNFLYN